MVSPRLELGRAPEDLTVIFTPGAFSTTLRSQGSDGSPVNWPTGASLRLDLSQPGWDASWPFTIVGPLASLSLTPLEVASVPDRPTYAALWLDYGDGEFLWCSGSVVRA